MRYAELLVITGGRVRQLHDLRQQPRTPIDADERRAFAERVHALENARHAGIVAERCIPLRPGVRGLFADCADAGVAMAVVTTHRRANLHAMLAVHFGNGWPACFASLVCGEAVARSKPDPQAYALAWVALGLAARDTPAIDDAPAGMAAAGSACIPVVVTFSRYVVSSPVDDVLALGPTLASVGRPHPRAASICRNSCADTVRMRRFKAPDSRAP